jgi:putative ABC transport system ATP-binding protein
MMAVPLIQVRNLYKSYHRDSLEIPVLSNINLDIGEGEFVAFMGPSGSGKTTLLNLIAGIDKPTSGSILIGGVEVTELNETDLAVWRSRNVGFEKGAACSRRDCFARRRAR